MISRRIAYSLSAAVFILVWAASLKYARNVEWISPETAKRAAQVTIGLMLAAYANVMPKDIGRLRGSVRAANAEQSVLRVGGWLLMFAGLAYAGFWAFTPVAFADAAGTAGVVAATLVMVTYGAWRLRADCVRRPSAADQPHV